MAGFVFGFLSGAFDHSKIVTPPVRFAYFYFSWFSGVRLSLFETMFRPSRHFYGTSVKPIPNELPDTIPALAAIRLDFGVPATLHGPSAKPSSDEPPGTIPVGDPAGFRRPGHPPRSPGKTELG